MVKDRTKTNVVKGLQEASEAEQEGKVSGKPTEADKAKAKAPLERSKYARECGERRAKAQRY